MKDIKDYIVESTQSEDLHEEIGLALREFGNLRNGFKMAKLDDIKDELSVLLVSKHLRHASTQQTLDTYSHLFPNETIGLMDKIF